MTAEEMIAQGYKSTSNKYRTVARLPPGKTGIEALREVSPHEYRDIMRQLEQRCADRYRCIYAEKNGDQLELSPEEFTAFKRAGGESSF